MKFPNVSNSENSQSLKRLKIPQSDKRRYIGNFREAIFYRVHKDVLHEMILWAICENTAPTEKERLRCENLKKHCFVILNSKILLSLNEIHDIEQLIMPD